MQRGTRCGEVPQLRSSWLFVLAYVCLASSALAGTYSTPTYSLTYPDRWQPSGIVYANAFEIRSYAPEDLQIVPQRNQTSLVAVQTTNDAPAATEAFLDGLLAGENAPERIIRALTVGGHRAVQVRRTGPAQQLARGASTGGPAIAAEEAPQTLLTIETHIADGSRVLSVQASVRTDADVWIVQDIDAISTSVSFPDTPQQVGTTAQESGPGCPRKARRHHRKHKHLSQ